MKKILILVFILAFTFGLASCEDKKVDSDTIIVVFFTGSNTERIQTLEIEKGTTIEAIDNPTRPGFSFDGWYVNNTFSIPFDFDDIFEVSTTLYAKWIPSINIITYELDGGTNSNNNPETFLTGQSIIFSQPTRFDSSFIGWYLSPPSEINPAVDKRITSTAGLAGDITLYAYFEGTSHVVTFNARGTGEFALPTSIPILNPRLIRVVGGALIPALPTPTPVNGYTFLGWWNATYEVQYLENTSYTLARSATFFAKWQLND
jgi:uncharacterized repeat protein (TIGR02543 family)